MTISYHQNMPAGFQDELNDNLRNIENEVGSLDKQVNHQHTVIEEHRLCIKSLNSLVEQQQKEIASLQSQIDRMNDNLLETIKTLTGFVDVVNQRLFEFKLRFDLFK